MTAPLHYDTELMRHEGEKNLTAFVTEKLARAETQAERDFIALQIIVNRCNIDISVALTEAMNKGLAPQQIARAIGAIMGCIKAGVISNLGRHDLAAIDAYFTAEHASALNIADGRHEGHVTTVHPMQGGHA